MACGRCQPICPEWKCKFTIKGAPNLPARTELPVAPVAQAPRSYASPNQVHISSYSPQTARPANDDQPVYKKVSGGT